MELLVYVRNHQGPQGPTRFVGASVGLAPSIEPVELEDRGPVTSLAEFRIDATAPDLIGELRAAVADVFTLLGFERHDRALFFSRRRSAIKVKLEPGFDTPLDIESDLAEMIALVAPDRESVMDSSVGFALPA